MKTIRRYAMQRIGTDKALFGIYRSVNGGEFKLVKDHLNLTKLVFGSELAAKTELEKIEVREDALHSVSFPTYVIHYENDEGGFKFAAAFCIDDYARAEYEAREYLLTDATEFESRFKIYRYESRDENPRVVAIGDRYGNEVVCNLTEYGEKVCRKAYTVRVGNEVCYSRGKQIAKAYAEELQLRHGIRCDVVFQEFENLEAMFKRFDEYSTEPHRINHEEQKGTAVNGLYKLFWHPVIGEPESVNINVSESYSK